MLTRICVLFAVLAATPMWAQVDSGANAGGGGADDAQMQTPPPVSSAAFLTAVGDELRADYLRLGVTTSMGYIDNLYAGESTGTLNETIYSISPMISWDRRTERQDQTFSYAPGFTLYQPSSTLNETNQKALGRYSLRLTPHSTIVASDAFLRTSTANGSAFAGVGGTVSGSLQSQAPGVVPPFAQLRSNMANGEFTLQTSRMSMIGIAGMAATLDYPNSSEATGLADSGIRAGTAFYNRRVTESQYLGATYQYSDFLTYPENTTGETQTHSITAFYTFYPTEHLSLSITGGPQHYEISEMPFPSTNGWGPSVMASLGWQGERTSFAANYSRQVTGGGGLLGAFDTSLAGASARWQISRGWTIAATGSYDDFKTLGALVPAGEQGGRTLSGGAMLVHAIGQRLRMTFDYEHVHEAYAGVVSIVSNPNSNQETVSVTWQLSRPLGR
ncbi:MAG TPA: hypothetical protein VME86_08410 [Acidobacteriaceae bacterium]|nr:hypothetical protein [Acidobacteriaceae bacterium]